MHGRFVVEGTGLPIADHDLGREHRRLAPLGTANELTGFRLDDTEHALTATERAVVGSPRLVLLDEPAAGLPDEETKALGEVIKQIPGRTGALTILVDHDMDLVGDTCDNVAVLDFGHVIASGPTREVLDDPKVMAAYLGTEDVEYDS